MENKLRICPNCKKEFKTSQHGQKFCSKACSQESRTKYLANWTRVNRHNLRSESEKKIGNKCILCGSPENIVFHEINGKPHVMGDWKARELYFLKNSEDFVPICRKQHNLIHQLAVTLHSKAEFEKAVEILKKLVKKPVL